MSRPKAVIITGPTGSGKSSLALATAKVLGGEIINADSLAFYRGLDIGTAKPTLAERREVPHHLFDILDPDEHFDAAAYIALARPLVEKLWQERRLPLIVGGTGLYLRSLTRGLFEGPGRDEDYRRELGKLKAEGQNLYELLQGIDPLAAARIAPRDSVRIERALEFYKFTGESIVERQSRHGLKDLFFDALLLIVERNVAELDERIMVRTEEMFRAGLIEETRELLAKGWSPDLKPLQSIGYRECLSYLSGQLNLADLKEMVYLRTRKLAKRQRTWFRGQMPEGQMVQPDSVSIIKIIQSFLETT